MDNKSVWEVLGIPGVFKKETKCKTILFFLADIIRATLEPSHIQHHCHEEYTKDSLWSILMYMSEQKRMMLTIKFTDDKASGEKADKFLNTFLLTKLKKLEEMVYRTLPLTQQELYGSSISYEESKLACLLASVLDVEEELESYVRKMMAPRTYRRLPKL